MTKREGENVWLNKFTGEVFAKPHDFIVIQAYNDCLDGPIIAIIYDEPELNWFNDRSLWSEELEDPPFVNQVLRMNELIHYITKNGGITKMSTYYVTVTNLDNCPKVTLSFDIEEKDFIDTAAICIRYFPSVEIVDNETGEVILTYYNNRQPYYPNLIRDVLDMIDPYIIKPEVQ